MAWDWLDDKLLGNSGEDTNAALRNPITAFNFVLEVEGGYFMALKSVRVFNKENEYEYIREGGVNDYVHMRRKPISKPFTFQVERYVGTERFLDPLANGTELMLPVILYVYRHKTRSAITESAPAWPARIYTFTGCVVTAKEYGELNAEKSAILTETTTIAYRELMVVTNPFEDSQELPAWKFPHDDADKISPKGEYADDKAVKNNSDFYERKMITFPNGETGTVWVRKDVKDGETVYASPWDIKENIKDPKVKAASDRSIKNDTQYYEEKEVTFPDGKKQTVRVRKNIDNNGNTKELTPWNIRDNTKEPKVKDADGRAVINDKDKYDTDDQGQRKRKDDAAKPRADEYKQGDTVKWASNVNEDSSQFYDITIDATGAQSTQRKADEGKSTKPRADEYKQGDTVKWANSKNDDSSEFYTVTTDEGGKQITERNADSEMFTKPRAGGYKRGDTVKWANNVNDNSSDFYTISADEEGFDRTVLNDGKPKWDIQKNQKDPKPDYAIPAANGDKLPPVKEPWNIKDNKKDPKPTYAKPADNGDDIQPPKVPWDIKNNKANPKPTYAKPAENGDGKQPAKEPWNIKDNKENPKPSYAKPAENGDGKQPAKEPWDIKSNTDNPKATYARPAENGDGKQPAKEPWDIKSNTDNPKATYATPAENGDGKQPAKEPWDIKSNTDNPRPAHAKPAENGDGKQPAKEPWDIKANIENPVPKYAKESPKDHEKPEVVKWPPTRRALMADTLSKK